MNLYLVHVGNKTLLGEIEMDLGLNDTEDIYLYSVLEVVVYPIKTPNGMMDMVDVKSAVPFRDKKSTDLFIKKPSFIIQVESTEELYKVYRQKRAVMSGIVPADALPTLPIPDNDRSHLRIVK